mmetsp:Transcript_35149/g.100639  ORF Transcript_35149/g.100639 Transcript_35149/m.100639 type:complete len:191 (-) Transcript_35149:38-610(-)
MGGVCSRCRPKWGESDDAPVDNVPLVKVGKKGRRVDVALDDTGIRVAGDGIALGDTVVEQDSAYWEVEVLDLGDNRGGATCQIGVAHDLSGQLLDSQLGASQGSWTVGAEDLSQGDVVGVAFGKGNLPNLEFYLNGKLLDGPSVMRITGEVFPAVSVAGGAALHVVFKEALFKHTPPGRSQQIIPAAGML